MNQQANVIDLQQQTAQNARSALDEIVREGARRMLQAAIEEEVAEVDEDGVRGEAGILQCLENPARVEVEAGDRGVVAGVLLAESEYRHELEIDIEPFKGLLMGLFFIAVGMAVDR